MFTYKIAVLSTLTLIPNACFISVPVSSMYEYKPIDLSFTNNIDQNI